MPVIILLQSVKHLLSQIKDQLKDKFEIEVHEDDFQTTKQKLSNLDKAKLYVLLNCDQKAYRYEIYCLIKKQETSYVVISKDKISAAKHDNPLLQVGANGIDYKKMLDLFNNNLKCSTAHKKKLTGGAYISNVKSVINKINNEYSPSLNVILEGCEERLMRMIALNPVALEEIEGCYKTMVKQAIEEQS